MAENYLMISRYVPLGLLCMLFFLGCSTVDVKQTEENEEIVVIEEKEEIPELSLDEKIDELTEMYIDDPQRLISEIEAIIEKDNFDYHGFIARLKLAIGDYSGAKKSITSIPLYEANIDHLKIFAICQMTLSEDYIKTLNEMLEIDSENIFALNNLAKVFLNNNNLNKAEEFLIKSYNRDNRNSETFILLGDLSLKRVDELGLKNKKVLNDREENFITSQYKRALEYYNKVGESSDASYYIKLSNIYKKLGKKLEAIIALDRAIELDPDDLWNYFDRGKLYFYMSSNAKALDDFLKVYAIDENHFFTNVFLGRLYFLENEIDRSFYHYKRVVELNPKYTPAFKELSVLYKVKGDAETSLHYLVALYRSKTDNDPLLPLYLVTSLIDTNNIDGAKNILVNLVKYEKKGTMKGIYNYFLDPSRTKDEVLNDALNIEDLYQRTRLTYYVSCALQRDGIISLSSSLFKEVADADIGFESKLAKYKLGEFNE